MYLRGSAYFKFYHTGRLLRIFSAGDILSVGPLYPDEDAKITCDFAADVIFLSASDVRKQLGDNPELLAKWLEYHETEQAITYGLCARYSQIDRQPDIRLKRFDAGKVIIDEGEESSEVLCLIDGLAEVRSQGVTVGEVRPSEFFGEIGFLLDQCRTASVIAKKACTVQSIDNAEFVEIIKHNPHVIVSLATTLASRIVELNKRVVGGQNG